MRGGNVNSVTTPVEPPPQETSALVPVLIAVLAAWSADKPEIPVGMPWPKVVERFKLEEKAGKALEFAAERAMSRWEKIPNGTVLKPVRDEAVQKGIEAGYIQLAEVLRSLAVGGTPPGPSQSSAPPRAVPSTPKILALPAGRDIPKDLRSRITPYELQRTADDLVRAISNSVGDEAAALMNWNKTWLSQRDDRVRSSHRSLSGKSVRATEPFVLPGGEKIRYPHDPLVSFAERVGCRCGFKISRGR